MKVPALHLATLLALGIGLGAHFEIPLPFAALPLLGLGAMMLGTVSSRFYIYLWPVALGLFLVSVDQAPHRELAPYQPVETPVWIELEGKISLRRSSSPQSPETYEVKTHQLTLPLQQRVLRGRNFRFKVLDQGAPFEPGLYKIEGEWIPPASVLNPHQVDWERQQKQRGWHGTLQIQNLELLEALSPSWLERAQAIAKRCHTWMAKYLTQGLPEKAQAESALILAMTLGTFPTEHTELQDDFIHSGTMHLFSVSGLHVAILAWICSRGFKPFPYQKVWSPYVTIACCFFYAFLTGWSAASVRAAVMIAVVLLSQRLAMRSSLLNSLGIAALLLLLAHPQELFQPGFQLSFAVMFGLGLSAEWGNTWVQSHVAPDPFLPRPFLTPQQRWFWSLRTQIAQVGLSSFAALLASTPLTLYYFNLITPVSLLANFVLIPLSFALLWIGTLSLFSGALGWSTGNELFNHANLAVSHACLKSAGFFANLPYAYHYPASDTHAPRLTVLALPRGEFAIHLAYRGQHWLVDLGSAKSYPFILKPYLRGEGVTSFEGIFTSHQDLSHRGALQTVKSQFQCRPLTEYQEVGRWRRREMRSTDGRIALQEWRPNWPTRVADDACAIFKIKMDHHTLFYLADAGFITESHLMEDFPASWLKCDVVLRAQHRSDLSLTEPLLHVMSPRLVVGSHSQQVLGEGLSLQTQQTCRMMGAPLYNLSSEGAISFTVEGNFLICQKSLSPNPSARRKK